MSGRSRQRWLLATWPAHQTVPGRRLSLISFSRLASSQGLVFLSQIFSRRSNGGSFAPAQGSRMSKGTSSDLNSEQDLASIPTAPGGPSRLAIARLKSAGVPVVPLLRRVGLTPQVIADPEEQRKRPKPNHASAQEAAIALQGERLSWLHVGSRFRSARTRAAFTTSWRLRRLKAT